MNPFKPYEGLYLNGKLYPKKDLLKAGMSEDNPPHLREVFTFAAKLFDKSKTLKVATSGSTGKPKKQEFSKHALVTSAEATNAFFGLKHDSRALLALPIRYIAGKMMVVRAIVGAYSLDVVEPSGQPLAHLTKSGDAKPYDIIPLTPYQALQSVEHQTKLLSKQKNILIGGGLVSDVLMHKLMQSKVNAYVSFGMTETLSHFAIAKLRDTDDEIVYKLLKGAEIKIRKNGLLRVKWKDITKGWLDTKDLVAPAKQGFVWLGRSDNLINSGGIKVIPELVEKRIAHLINVPFFVSGTAHDKLGEEVSLFVEMEGKVPAGLLSDVQHVLSDTPFWQPRKLIAVPKFLYTTTGKIMRSDTVAHATL